MASNDKTVTERGRPSINTDAVRGVVRTKIADMERHREIPGAILRDTVPGLCDEVDFLRAEVGRQAGRIDALCSEIEAHLSGLAKDARVKAAERALADERAKVAAGLSLAAGWLLVPHGPHSGGAVGDDCVACMGGDVRAALAGPEPVSADR